MNVKHKVLAVCLCMVAAICMSIPLTAWADSGDSGKQTLVAGAIDTGLSSTGTKASKSKVPYVSQTTNMGVGRATGITLANGTYTLTSAHDSKFLVKADGKKAKSKLSLSSRRVTTAAVWKFTYQPSSKSYVISNVRSGHVLATNGKTAFLAKPADTDKVRWIITSTSNGYIISSKYYAKYKLMAKGKESARVKCGKSSDTADTRFWISKYDRWTSKNNVKNGVYTIQTAAGNGQLMQVKGASLKAKQTINIAKQHKADLNQMFEITSVRKGYYKIVDVGSGQALTARGSKRVVQKPYGVKTNTRYQQWKVQINSDGTVSFINRGTGKALDIRVASAKDGTKVSMTKLRAETKDTQKWMLSPTTTGLTYTESKGLERANRNPQQHKQNYTISIDLTSHYLMIFKRDGKNKQWKLFKEWRVSNGNSTHRTLEMVGWKSRFREQNSFAYSGYLCYYWSRMGGYQYMHSFVKYATWTDTRLGGAISGGCVRMTTENAKYIYYEIPEGTRVQRYY